MVIDKFEYEHAFLSNFYWADAAVGDEIYPTSEHAFQAAKTEDPQERKKVRAAKSPGMAKRIGRRVAMRRNWDQIKNGVMHAILKSKFSNPELRDKLLATGDAKLVEGNTWHDNYWGSCTCAKCGNHGKNVLGRLLMDLREELRNADQSPG